MDSFLSGVTGSDPSKKQPSDGDGAGKSTTELFSSAKLVADAAQTKMSGDKSKDVDMGKTAGAAADLLGAASDYGKLDQKGYGQYVDKAEKYLNDYESSHSTTTPAAGGGTGGGAGGGGEPIPEDGRKPSSEPSGDQEGGGYGGYLKMAQGFLK